MEKEIIELAKQISEVLKKEYNPHVTVEIDSEGVKITSVDYYEPTEVKKTN